MTLSYMKKHSLKKISAHLLMGASCVLLSACGTLFDKDNTPKPTPLTNFTAEKTPRALWNASTSNGIDGDYLKLVPALNGQYIFTAGKNGTVTATNRVNGSTYWTTSSGITITAGAAANDDLVIVAGQQGEVVALTQSNGRILWRTQVSSEVLAPPTANNRIVFVKTNDGHLFALSAQDGHSLWSYQQTEPTLILRSGSAPVIDNNIVLAGFANGTLAKFTANDGDLIWQQPISTPKGTFSIQRMVDIDADPIVFNRHIYAASYQGRITSLDFNSGKINWAHDLSAYAGIAADFNKVYVSDAQGDLWAFDAQTGSVLWHQTQLAARNLTGPATMGDYVVVGDGEGYLHWLSSQDGHFVARVKVDGSGLLAAPIVYNNILYVTTGNGHLAAYAIT